MGTTRNSVFLWRRGILTLLILCFAIGFTFAQERVVKGKVTSAAEGPLPGVNIVLKGTTTGTMTDASGNYSINVPGPEAVLEYSFISYTTQSITVGAQATIDVVLAPSLSTLSEVVVVGYGTQKKREVTSSIVSVKSDEFNKGSVSTPVQLIQGKVSGLAISRPGGDPNGTYDIRLRGLSTIGANQGPLIVIDGNPGGSLDNVDPNDIESINVLKDGSAAAIYGTRGSSGVILVTTKKGRKGTTSIEYNIYGTMEMVSKNTDVMNAAEWRALSAEMTATAGKQVGTDYGASTDWFKQIEQTAYTQVHNLSLSGGSDNTTYRASVNYRNSNGIMINTGYSQINGRFDITQKALNDKLTVDVNIGATEKKAQLGFTDAFKYATIYNPTSPVHSDPATDLNYTKYAGWFQSELFDYYNPVEIATEDFNNRQDRIYNLSVKAAYEISKGFIVDAFYSKQLTGQLNDIYYNKYSYYNGINRNGLGSREERNTSSQLLEATAHYVGDITSSINLTALGGYSYQDFKNEGFKAEGGNFLTNQFTFDNLQAALDFANGKGTITSYANTNKLISFFGRINLNINSTWFVTASARYEGSSRFGTSNKWGLFPAIGAGADISKLLNVSFIDNLKVRANYGITGNQPNDSYLSLLRMGPVIVNSNPLYFFYNGAWGPAYGPVSNANTDLKWEKKGEFDAGVDFSMFNSKLSGSFDFYTRTTTNLLFQYNVPVPPNLYNQAWLNLGKIRSSGLELTLDYTVIKKADLTYGITLTPSYNLENTLVSLSGSFNGSDLKYGQQDLSNMGSPGQNQVPLVRVEEGKPIGQLLAMVYQGIDENGNFIFKDTNGDGTVDQADRAIVGNGLPKLLIGFGNNVAYKNWDLNIFFRGVFGHDLVNSFRAFYEVPAYIQSYNLPKSVTSLRNPTTGALLTATSGTLSSKDVENASFVSLDNVALGYNFILPKTSAINKIRVYVAGNNLFYITKYKGVSPEPRYVDSATDMGTYNSPLVPGIDRRSTWFSTRGFTVGANVVF